MRARAAEWARKNDARGDRVASSGNAILTRIVLLLGVTSWHSVREKSVGVGMCHRRQLLQQSRHEFHEVARACAIVELGLDQIVPSGAAGAG